ncbi:MAG: hypothetical protein VXZ82_07470 [Planctomycetota bacterium]|nr:hypothetical protein [Planctomycetota bacterium]
MSQEPNILSFEDYQSEPSTSVGDDRQQALRVSAGEVLALMMHAARTRRMWIEDFADETLFVSPDMYEVLVTYKRIAFETNSKAA